ncbi:MAG: serine hydrolase, partial [Planctomycetota bacterium]
MKRLLVLIPILIGSFLPVMVAAQSIRPAGVRIQPPQARRSPENSSSGMGGLNIASNGFQAQFDAAIVKHFQKKNIPGLVVLMARDGMVTYQKTLGFADIENGIPMTKDKVFRLASVSKWVAGIMALKMEQDGQVDLNSKLKDYLTEIPDHHHSSRIIDTLTCRAGIRHYSDAKSPLSPTGWEGESFESAELPVEHLWNDPLAAPYSIYHYSTMSYCFAARALELASGRTCKELIRDKISNPFGISTLRAEDLDLSIAQRVKYYQPIDNNNLSQGNELIADLERIEWKVYGGGLECSAYDLLRLGMKLCGGQILGQSQLNRMLKPVDNQSSYNIGCNAGVENGNRLLAKSGGQDGVSTYIWMVPEKQMVMVVLANRREGSDAMGLGKKLRKIALGTNKAGNRKPDLIVEDFQRTGNAYYANGKLNVPVSYRIRNQGGGGTTVPVANAIRFGSNWYHTAFMSTLPPGTGKTVQATVRIQDPGKIYAGRTITLVAAADAPITAGDSSIQSEARVEESFESNNTKTIQFKAPGGISGLSGTRQ